MFLCAGDARPRASYDPHAVSRSRNTPAFARAPPDSHIHCISAPSSRHSLDSSAYFQLLDTLTRLVAQLVNVHTLSQSLRFSAGKIVTIDAAKWWQEVQRQSVALVQQQEAASVVQQAEKWTRRRSVSTCIQENKAKKPFRRLEEWILSAPETFQDVPVDIWTAKATEFFVQALYLLLQTLERVNTRQELLIPAQDDKSASPIAKIFASVDASVAFAAAKLLQRWVAAEKNLNHIVNSTAKLSQLKMGVTVVNVLLQPLTFGMQHVFHDHVLLPSVPQRAFLRVIQWSCSVCARETPTTMGIHSDNTMTIVYRCPACNFNLCRECLTRIPNEATPPNHARSRSSSSDPTLTKQAIDRFFALVIPQVTHYPDTAIIVLEIAQELRRRVLELYPHHFKSLVACTELWCSLVTSDPSAPLALVQASSASSSFFSAVTWFPVFSRTWTMSLSTLFGPFLRASTMLDGTHDLDAAVRATTGSIVVTESFRTQWMEGFTSLRTIWQTLGQTLLADNQHPLVVDATLGWLALTLLTADSRRRLIKDTHEPLDGFLINISTMLLAHTLPVLEKAQHAPDWIDARYHLSVDPVRVYAHKDFPDVPLHYSHDATASMKTMETEFEELAAQDKISIATYQESQARSKEEEEEEEEKVSSTFYPRLSCHEGIVCDQCELSHFYGVRYKCAFCEDMDLCSECFESFRSQQAATDVLETKTLVHDLTHVFLRIESPIPMVTIKHFEPFPLDWLRPSKEDNDGIESKVESSNLHCCDCGNVLGAKQQPEHVFYKCVNCFSTRLVCPACLTREEEQSHGNPSDLHAPGHVYLVMTDSWRHHLSMNWLSVLEKLHFRRLLHPPALLPRRRFSRATEVFYLTLKYLHFGPLATLSRWLTMMKEIHELQALCACDEEQLAFERRRRCRSKREKNDDDDDDASSSSSSFSSLQLSAHYKASKARLLEMRVSCAKMELHLLSSEQIVEWVVFYARSCRWLLQFASASSDPYTAPLTQPASIFWAFPEHFFVDLCDVVTCLSLEHVVYHAFVNQVNKSKKKPHAVEPMDEVVEPLLVLLTQLVIAPTVTKNPHLRVEALRALTILVTFVSQGHQAGYKRLNVLFQRHELFSRWFMPGLLQFHADMDRYNVCTNGLALPSAVQSGDHILWGLLPTRLSVTLLLRYLWQFPSQRQSLFQALTVSNIPVSIVPDVTRSSTEHLTHLVSGLWSDIAKLFEEATTKSTTLRQIHELFDDSVNGNVVVLPFRRELLDGYVAMNGKHLRLTMRLLVEALELTSWFASFVDDEASISRPAAALRQLLLQPLLVEQAARIVSFLIASLATVHEEKDWTFSVPLRDDGKLLLAHVIVLVVRYGGHACRCSPTSYWKLVRASGEMLARRIGDLETLWRWQLNAVCTRLEAERYLGATFLNEDEELEKDDAGKKERGGTTTRRGTTRFLAMVAKDGRFDCQRFVTGCCFLRQEEREKETFSEDKRNEAERTVDRDRDRYLYLDASWVQHFVSAMDEADAMIQAQQAVEAFLGALPARYLDPLLNTLMADPVRLPSGNIVDRTVIARHLVTARNDPFTREPLTMAMLQPCDALRKEIHLYLRTNMQHFSETRRDQVLAAWGLGWEMLVERTSETDRDSEE